MPFSYSSFDILHSKLGNGILINGKKIKDTYLKEIVEKNSVKYFECLNLYNKIFKHNHVSLSFVGDAIMRSYLNGDSLSI